MVKECEEEASIPRELAQRATPVGAVSYASEQAEGLKRDVLFCYDLELPNSFEPKPQVSCLRASDPQCSNLSLRRAKAFVRLPSTQAFNSLCSR